MSLPPGHRLGSFEVVALLGAGGMGEVYRARDTRLNREVAIKVLPARFLTDAERRVRFEREAQVLASLNHPHIAHIYGLEPADAGDALVMELVEGRTLADRLRAGPLALAEALEIARQIALALEAAHDRGIVHRDLKPANIKVRDDGTVKVLDFGLAKALGADPVDGISSDVGDSPTMSAAAFARGFGEPGTEQGVILGTASYMSPEQARGRPIDQRTDIWAFGCVVYELVTGKQAFGGDTMTDVLAAVVSTEPDLSRAPVQVRRLLRACLQKDSRRRLRHIGDAMALVDDDAATESGATAIRASRSSRVTMAALGLVALAAVSWAILSPRRSTESSSIRLELPTPEATGSILLSPDGRYLLQSAQLPGSPPHLVLRSMATGDLRELPATDGVRTGFWSPDSQTIGFVQRGALKTIPVGGGQPTVVAPSGVGDRGCWSPGGFIAMNASASGIVTIPAGGGAAVAVTTIDRTRSEIHHELPACMPDGRFLYYRHLAETGTSGIYLGDPRLTPEQQRLTPVLVAADGPVFVPGTDGRRQDLLFMQGTTLFVQAFDVGRAELVGEPQRVADPVGSSAGSGYFSASATGLLVFVTPPTIERQLTWIDRNGAIRERIGPAIRALRGLRIAPDGTRAMLTMFPQDRPVNNDNLTILPFDGRPLAPFATDDTEEASPMWSADGTKVAYLSGKPGSPAQIVQRSADGGRPETLAPLAGLMPLSDWSPDARFVLLAKPGAGTGNDIFVVRLTGANREPEPLIQDPGNASLPKFSPDGQWLAYLSSESSRSELYVRRFDVSPDGAPSSPESGRRLVSNGGVRGLIRWRRDGRELTYMSADGKLMVVDVTPGTMLTLGTPRPLFTFPEGYLKANPTTAGIADMAPDGSRWLIAMPPESARTPTLQVIVNWRPAAGPGR